MGEKPFFSIIIPTLNEEVYLPLLLTDLTRQQVKNFEVIVVDGSSEDKTLEKVNTFSSKLPIHIVTVKKRKLAYQRNIGAKHAKGQWFIFLDADSRIERNFIGRLQQTIEKKSPLVLVPYVMPNSKSSRHKIFFSVMNSIIEASQYFGKQLCSPGVFCIDRRAFTKVGGYNEKLFVSEDHDIMQRLYKTHIKGYFDKKTRVLFSLRRYEREGEIKVLYKYVTIFLYMLKKGKIYDQIVSYEMGGKVKARKQKRSFLKPEMLQKLSSMLHDLPTDTF